MVICLERDADLHVAQLMPLPLTVSCFTKIQIGFTFLVPAHQGSPGKRAVKRVCVKRVCVLPSEIQCCMSVMRSFRKYAKHFQYDRLHYRVTNFSYPTCIWSPSWG